MTRPHVCSGGKARPRHLDGLLFSKPSRGAYGLIGLCWILESLFNPRHGFASKWPLRLPNTDHAPFPILTCEIYRIEMSKMSHKVRFVDFDLLVLNTLEMMGVKEHPSLQIVFQQPIIRHGTENSVWCNPHPPLRVLPSGRTLRVPRSRLNCYEHSFISISIKTLSANVMKFMR